MAHLIVNSDVTSGKSEFRSFAASRGAAPHQTTVASPVPLLNKEARRTIYQCVFYPEREGCACGIRAKWRLQQRKRIPRNCFIVRSLLLCRECFWFVLRLCIAFQINIAELLYPLTITVCSNSAAIYGCSTYLKQKEFS